MNDPTTMLYRQPGPHQLQDGKYDYLVVPDTEIEQTLADGWFLTTAEAKEAYDESRKGQTAAIVDNAPPTRAELEQKAAQIGLKYDGRIGDKKLAAMIAAELQE